MKGKVSVEEKEYAITSKFGMEDVSGEVIIPRKYDVIIRISPRIFAAIEDNCISYADTAEGVYVANMLTQKSLNLMWENPLKKKFSTTNIDFYSVNGKFKLDKKVIACYWSDTNEVLVLFDENNIWSIAHVDYEKQEIIEESEYKNITDIKEIAAGRFLIKRNDAYEIISLTTGERIGPLSYKYVENFEKGIVFQDKDDLYGFMDYSGKVILVEFKAIKPNEGYITVTTCFNQMGVYSYTGECIVAHANGVYFKRLKNGLQVFKYVKMYGSDKILYGVASEKDQVLLPKYTDIKVLDNGMIIYCEDNKYGLLSYGEEGIREILPLKYKDICILTSKSNDLYIGAKLRLWYDIYNLEGRKLKGIETPPELWALKDHFD